MYRSERQDFDFLSITTLLGNNNTTYTINLLMLGEVDESLVKEYDQILSTFKFIE